MRRKTSEAAQGRLKWKPLGFRAAGLPNQLKLLGGFDALRRGLHAKVGAETGDGPYDRFDAEIVHAIVLKMVVDGA
jgi:hypothetical protein